MTHKKPTAKVKAARRKKATCSVPECGRPAAARGLCQSHHLQKRTTGKVKPIRPYRKRSTDTVKFAGSRLTSRCADRIREYADKRKLSLGAAIADVLEDQLARNVRRALRSQQA